MEIPEQQIASSICVAFDHADIKSPEAQFLLEELEDTGAECKIGRQITTINGWPFPIREAQEHGLEVFADAKLHDIGKAVTDVGRIILAQKPKFISIFADSSMAGLKSLVMFRNEISPNTQILGITVPTDKSDEEVMSDYGCPREVQVLHFADKILQAGLDGIICSPQELRMLAEHEDFDHFEKVTPSIRPSWSVSNDQKNYATPTEAIKWGATRLVIGRPITEQFYLIGGTTPLDAFWAVFEEVKRARAA